MRAIILGLFCMSILTSCNFSPLEYIYFQRVKFSFIDADNENKLIFLCTKEETPEETRLKAEKANKEYTEESAIILKAFTDDISKQFEGMIDDDEDTESDFSFIDSMSITWDLQKKTEALVIRLEAEHKCLLADMIEIE